MKFITLAIDTLLEPSNIVKQYVASCAAASTGVNVEVVNSSSDNNDVLAFHSRFGVPMATEPSLLGDSVLQYRSGFLQEELDEFTSAADQGDLNLAGDALIDLVYVAHGTALMMNLPWQSMWNEVHDKNMQKVRASHAGESTRKSALDVIKPAGWMPPDHAKFIGHGPWPEFNAEELSK